MQLVSVKDYCQDGVINWRSYKKALVRNGEECPLCGQAPPASKWGRGEALCADCHAMQTAGSGEEMTHDRLIRCPSCGDIRNPRGDFESMGSLVNGGRAWCSQCNHVFEVEVEVEYTFTSPPMCEESRSKENG